MIITTTRYVNNDFHPGTWDFPPSDARATMVAAEVAMPTPLVGMWLQALESNCRGLKSGLYNLLLSV
jgi:hypothetical protein